VDPAPFLEHQERQKTRLAIADKIAQFYADLLFNWNLEHSSADGDRKKEAGWRRESDMQLLAALSTQLASVFSPQAINDYYALDAALRRLSEMPAEASPVRMAASKLIGDLYAEGSRVKSIDPPSWQTWSSPATGQPDHVRRAPILQLFCDEQPHVKVSSMWFETGVAISRFDARFL
jgi:hypothetical protein